MPQDKKQQNQKPSGISGAVIKGAREGADEPSPPGHDSKVVEGNGRTTENDEAPMGGAPVAFPAPSAQPTRVKPTEQPAKIDVSWTEDEADDPEWQRAGGGKETKKPDKPQ